MSDRALHSDEALLVDVRDGSPMSRIADDFYLIVHSDRSGQLEVTPRVASLGLATALVAELLLSGHLAIHQDGLYPLRTAAWPENRLGYDVLRAVSDLRQDRLVGGWLRFLAVDAVDDVRKRLVAEGVLTQQNTGLLRRRVSYPPVNANDAAWPAIRLARRLALNEPLTAPDAALVGMVTATGLLDVVLWDPLDHAPGRSYAAIVRAGLPPPLPVLLNHTEACIANAVLTRH